MADTNESILDMEVISALRSLEEDGAPGLFKEIVELFLSDTPPRMKNLEAAALAGDMKGVEASAHSLKSSCGNLGATMLVELFKRIEQLGREQSPDEISSLVSRSADEYVRVENALLNEQ